MNRAKNKTICVVDPNPDDYLSLTAWAEEEGVQLRFLTSARAALRVSPRERPEMWVVNVRLPDLSGIDLQTMLRSRFRGVPVHLVGDAYSPEEEMEARASGAAMYFNKPLQSEWLLGSEAHVAA